MGFETTTPNVAESPKIEGVLHIEKPVPKAKETKTDVSKLLQDDFYSYLQQTADIEPDDDDVTMIPTGIDILDVYAGGGFPTALLQIIGNPGSGKTALLGKVLGNIQKLYMNKAVTIFADAEEAMTKQRLKQLGVNNPPLEPITGLTVEKIFKILEAMCIFKMNNKALKDIPFALAWDSIANTSTNKALVSDDVNTVLGEKARVLTHYLPKAVSKLKRNKISLMAINQLRSKIDMGIFKTANELKFLGDKTLPGGQSLLFNSAQILFLQPSTNIQEFDFSGFIVRAKFVKNKFFTPNIDFKLVFSFERGFSNFWSNWLFLKETKRAVGAAWSYLKDYPELKFRQKEAITKYRTDPKFKQVFDDSLKEAIQTEIIDQYKSDKEENNIDL